MPTFQLESNGLSQAPADSLLLKTRSGIFVSRPTLVVNLVDLRVGSFGLAVALVGQHTYLTSLCLLHQDSDVAVFYVGYIRFSSTVTSETLPFGESYA
jgi:hypothetical protein